MSDQGPKPRKKQPVDLNRLAFSITQNATVSTREESILDRIDRLARELTEVRAQLEREFTAAEIGRLGGLKGGKARAAKLKIGARTRSTGFEETSFHFQSVKVLCLETNERTECEPILLMEGPRTPLEME